MSRSQSRAARGRPQPVRHGARQCDEGEGRRTDRPRTRARTQARGTSSSASRRRRSSSRSCSGSSCPGRWSARSSGSTPAWPRSRRATSRGTSTSTNRDELGALGRERQPDERRAQPPLRGARGGEPAQVGVPREHVARAADTAQRDHRLLAGAARADVRRREREAGGVPRRHPRLGEPPALADQRRPRPVQGRGRAGGARDRAVLAAGGARARGRRWCGSGRARTASASRSRRIRTPTSSRATSAGSSR